MAQEVLTTRINISVAGTEEGRKMINAFNKDVSAFKKRTEKGFQDLKNLGVTPLSQAYKDLVSGVQRVDKSYGELRTSVLSQVAALNKETSAVKQASSAQAEHNRLLGRNVRRAQQGEAASRRLTNEWVRQQKYLLQLRKASEVNNVQAALLAGNFGKLATSSKFLRGSLVRLNQMSWRIHGITGGLVRLITGGLIAAFDNLGGPLERTISKFRSFGKIGVAALGALGVAAAAIVVQFAAMTAGVGALVAQVNRLDQVARTNPLLSFADQQRIANAEQLARLQPGEASRSLRYLKSSAARALAGDERRAGAFAALGLDVLTVANADADELLASLRKIQEVSQGNPSAANVQLQTISDGEQYRAAEIQNLAARADLLEQGFQKLPLADTREQLEAIPRALNEIGLGFQRIFVVIGLGQNGVLTPLLRWLAHFLEMTALWLHQNPILAKFIGIVLVGAMAALTVAVVALAAGWIKAGIAALWAKAIMHKGLIGIGLAVAGTAILLSQISSASRQATNIVGAVGQGARQYGTPAIGSAAFRGARYVGNQAAQRIPVTQNNEITIMGVSDPREAADMVGDRLLADMELAQGR